MLYYSGMTPRSQSDFLTVTALDPAADQPLYLQLADAIAAAITLGAFLPGRQIPTEAAMCAALSVSRVTVRQAIDVLVKSGQLKTQRGKGTFVARPMLQQDLSGLRGFYDNLRAQGVEPVTELLEFSAHAGRLNKSPDGALLPVKLRRLYRVEREAFAVVDANLPADAARFGVERAKHFAVYEILTQFLGLKIERAEVSLQCTRPPKRVLAELGLPTSHVLQMDRTSYADGGVACERTSIYIVPERYSFRLTTTGAMEIAPSIARTSPRRRIAA